VNFFSTGFEQGGRRTKTEHRRPETVEDGNWGSEDGSYRNQVFRDLWVGGEGENYSP